MNSSLNPARKSEITFENIELKDCGVVALQAVTRLRRQQAVELLSEHGYSPDTGTTRGGLEKALDELGIGWELMDLDPTDTVATFALRHEWGRFLVYVEGHVMGLIDGDLYNSRGHWHDRLSSVTRIKEED